MNKTNKYFILLWYIEYIMSLLITKQNIYCALSMNLDYVYEINY
jgi:hypothetical protein